MKKADLDQIRKDDYSEQARRKKGKISRDGVPYVWSAITSIVIAQYSVLLKGPKTKGRSFQCCLAPLNFMAISGDLFVRKLATHTPAYLDGVSSSWKKLPAVPSQILGQASAICRLRSLRKCLVHDTIARLKKSSIMKGRPCERMNDIMFELKES